MLTVKRIHRAACRLLLAAALVFLCWPHPCWADRIRQVSAERLPGFSDDLGLSDLAGSVENSMAYYKRLPGGRRFDFGDDSYSAEELAAGLRRFKDFLAEEPSEKQLRKFLEKHARVYESVEEGQPLQVLFTGYYEPVLEASRKKTGKFSHPVYRRPADLVEVRPDEFGIKCSEKSLTGRKEGGRLVPYYDRRTIEKENVLESKADAIAWTDDPVKLFFLHVQGSGKIRIQGEKEPIRVHYDVTNGRPYRSIGKYLIDRGKIEAGRMSMQAIEDYINRNPSEMEEIFFYNPRYVFFKVSDRGPSGSLGVELTPGRSAALDQDVFPAGALLFVSAIKPVAGQNGELQGWEPFSRFMCNQDSGAAIKGPARADIFWGSGSYAETAAGHMKHRGRLYFVVIEPESGFF